MPELPARSLSVEAVANGGVELALLLMCCCCECSCCCSCSCSSPPYRMPFMDDSCSVKCFFPLPLRLGARSTSHSDLSAVQSKGVLGVTLTFCQCARCSALPIFSRVIRVCTHLASVQWANSGRGAPPARSAQAQSWWPSSCVSPHSCSASMLPGCMSPRA